MVRCKEEKERKRGQNQAPLVVRCVLQAGHEGDDVFPFFPYHGKYQG